VMFVANDFAAGFVNGTRGQVLGFQNGLPQVRLSGGRVITVEPHNWQLTEDDRKRAEVVQLPLRLAWAITIHKSQGMSLDAAEIDLSRAFTPGMGYVALSRVRTLGGVYLTGINNLALQLHPEIYEFDRQLRQTSAALAVTTPDAAPEAASVSATRESVEAVYDPVLLQRLKSWRLDRARRDRVAPFMVAHNTTLEALAERPPMSRQQLLGIKGFGPAKLETYGDEILAVIQQYLTSAGNGGNSMAAKQAADAAYASVADIDRELLKLLQQRRQYLGQLHKLTASQASDAAQPAPKTTLAEQAVQQATTLGLEPELVRRLITLIQEDDTQTS
jgi:ATP-dependent DNA helicase PIF1